VEGAPDDSAFSSSKQWLNYVCGFQIQQAANIDYAEGKNPDDFMINLLTLVKVFCIIVKALSESVFIFPEFQLSATDSNNYGRQKPPTHDC
jgi:hypothetical protein